MRTINCKGKIISMDKPLIMGIINATDQSFYKGYLQQGTDAIVKLAGEMIAAGADIIDLGAQSTRPGSTLLTASEEADNLLPVVEAMMKQFPNLILSIDSFYATVASEAVKLGAAIINDISGGEMDNEMISTVAALQVPYVCMHMQGTPQNMQQNPQYHDVVVEVLDYLIKKKERCLQAGIKDLIIDPGFGFGKTIDHNYQLLKNLSAFKMLDCAILVGVSRKSMIYKPLQLTPDTALNGTTFLNALALNNGANILRVHDVKEAAEAVALFDIYQSA